MNDTIVIDFGTSRTKAAYCNFESKPELIKLGERDFLPSIFYVEESGKILYGEIAQSVLENQEIGQNKRTAPIRGLKLKLDRTHRRWKVPYRADKLLKPLFKHIRGCAANTDGFDKPPPTKVILTTTKAFSPADRKVLERAAHNVGFEEVTLITEPEAVAKGWVTATSHDRSHVIVVDCGGGTTDWTYLHRENRDFRIVPELSGGFIEVGGHNVDKHLAEFVSPKHQQDPRLLDKVSRIKEMFCDKMPEEYWVLPKIEDKTIPLESKQIEQAIREAFIDPVCKAIKPFIQDVKEKMGKGKGEPAILLVGGSAKLHGLKEAFVREFGCEVNPDWTGAEFAPVLGAVPIPSSTAAQANQDPVEALENELANQFDDIALLVGKRQDEEVEFVVGEEKQTVAPGVLENYPMESKLRECADEMRRGVLGLAVLGDASAGKSTLINAMVGQELLPTGHAVCTCIPTEIVYERELKNATIFKKGNKTDNISLNEFKEVAQLSKDEQQQFGDEKLTRPEELKDVLYARLGSDSALCKAGIRLVDTLGINADPLSDAVTKDFIKQGKVHTLLVLTSFTTTMSKTTSDALKSIAESRKDAVAYEHIFFVHNFRQGKFVDEEKITADKKKAESDLYNHLESIFGTDENLYERRVFIVDAQEALAARTNSDSTADLERSGLLSLEAELLNFMRSKERISVVIKKAFIDDLVPAIDYIQKYIAGKQEHFGQSEAERIERRRRTEAGLLELMALVQRRKDTVQNLMVDIQNEAVREYQYKIEDHLNPRDFEQRWDIWVKYIDQKSRAVAEEYVEEEVHRYLKDRFAKVIEEVNQKFPLVQMIKEALDPGIQEFFDTLDTIALYKTSEEGLLDDVQTRGIKVEDTFSLPFNILTIRFDGNWWSNPGWWRFIKRVKNANTLDRTKDNIVDELGKIVESLSEDGEIIETIKEAILQEVSNIVDTIETRLNEEIKVIEQQLADDTFEEERLQKIYRILTAKYEEISRAVYGKVLDRKELREAINQSK